MKQLSNSDIMNKFLFILKHLYIIISEFINIFFLLFENFLPCEHKLTGNFIRCIFYLNNDITWPVLQTCNFKLFINKLFFLLIRAACKAFWINFAHRTFGRANVLMLVQEQLFAAVVWTVNTLLKSNQT